MEKNNKSKKTSTANDFRSFGVDQTLVVPSIGSSESFPSQYLYKEAYNNFQTHIYSPAFETGYYDVLALSREFGEDPDFNLSFSNINQNYLFSIDNFRIMGSQESDAGQRFAGEGANPNSFALGPKEYNLSFTYPFKVDSWGYLDFSLAAFFDYCIEAFKGSPTSFLGRFTTDNNSVIGVGSTFLYVDNIVDFLSFDVPFNAKIKTDSSSYSDLVEVTAVDKTNRRLTVRAGINTSFNRDTSFISAYPVSSVKEPTFNLFSLKQGLMSGCLVDKFSVNFIPGEQIVANIEVKVIGVDRTYQTQMYNQFGAIMQNYFNKKPSYILNGYNVRVYKSAPEYGMFGLGGVLDSKLFRGFQQTQLDSMYVTEMTVSIENNLKPVYTLNAKGSDKKLNFFKNSLPYGYYSEGRKISGSITYTGPIKPWAMVEFLSGPSSINNDGITFDMGPIKLELPEVIWSTDVQEHSKDGFQKSKVNFSVATQNYTFDPVLKSTGNY
jgi:hypothetical protein